MVRTNAQPIVLHRDVSEALAELERYDPRHPYAVEFSMFIEEYPSLENGGDTLLRFKPPDLPPEEDPFEAAMVEFLALIEDAIEVVRDNEESTDVHVAPDTPVPALF